MKDLRTRFYRFCYQNRDKGIPNLMLYITVGSAIVYLMSLFGGTASLYSFLCFNKAAILRGQIWRLLTYVFTENTSYSPFLVLISLYFFYNLGRHVELSMGTFRFNLFYFSGVLIMDIFAMIFSPTSGFATAIYANMAFYLHLSILLMYATTNPDAQFLIFFILPVKAWFLGLVYLLLISMDVIKLWPLLPHNLFPLVGLLNYLLFAGKDVLNLFPFVRPIHRRRKATQRTGAVPFRKQGTTTPAYSHRCTICGRTDVSDPQLEFRYCSRCNGYYCYCQDHISNHTHIE